MQSESPTVRGLLHARLDALLDECNLVTANADYGQTLDDMEEFFFTKGRQFLHDTFQEKLQDHTEAAAIVSVLTANTAPFPSKPLSVWQHVTPTA